MSSELVKKLEDREQTLRENSLVYRLNEGYDYGVIDGFLEATNIVKQHEAEQMKEPFYQLTEEQIYLLNELQIIALEIHCFDLNEVLDNCYHKRQISGFLSMLWESLDVIPKNQVFNAFTTWAIEQEKMEEEEK